MKTLLHIIVISLICSLSLPALAEQTSPEEQLKDIPVNSPPPDDEEGWGDDTEEEGWGDEGESEEEIAVEEDSIETTATPALDLPFHGFLRSTMAHHLPGKADGFSSAQVALEIEYDKRMKKKYRFHFVGQASHEFVYGIEGRQHYSKEEIDEFENYLDLKELWLSMKEESFDIYFGRQIVPWGETDGLPITDLITPRDLSQFFYKNLEDMRLGVTMTRANYYWGKNTLSLLAVHEFRPTRLAPEGSEFDWRPALMESFEQLPFNVTIGDHITPSINTRPEWGIRLMMPGPGYDIGVMAASLFDDDFVFKAVDKSFNAADELTGATLDLEHNRFNMFGFTANKLIDRFVIKTEMAYYQGKSFNVSSEEDVFPVEKRDVANLAIGFDYTHSDQLTIILNHQYQKILDFEDKILGEEEINLTFVNFALSFMNDSLKPNYTVFYAWEDDDFVHKVKVAYETTLGFNISAGVDIIDPSDTKSRIGQLKDTSRAWAEVKYSF